MRSITMSRIVSVFVMLLAAAAPLLAVRPAWAETTTAEYTAQVNYVYAVSECLARRVFVQASTFDGGTLFVNVQDFAPCTGEEFPDSRMVFGPLPPGDFTISEDLDKARLKTSVQACFEGEIACLPMDINLVWHATGPATITTEPGQFCGEDFNGTAVVSVRPAVAHGAVKIDGAQSYGDQSFAQLQSRITACP